MKNKKALVIDYGIFPEVAVRLARDCGNVKYFCYWADPFPELTKAKIGDGMDGIERVNSFMKYLDDVDFIVIPDTMCADLTEFLKKKDYPVAGAGASERLELDRWYGRQMQKKHGLAVQETHKIVGVDNLRKFLMENKNFYIKIDTFRGVLESFKHTDWKSSEQEVDNVALKAGPYKNEMVFICEELLDGIEPGIDAITFDGELLFPTMAGFEAKGVGIIERTYNTPAELPPALQEIHNGLQPIFKENKTRFFYSAECKIGKDKIPYLIDPTIRLAAPGTSAVQFENITNYSEVMYGLATGKKVTPSIKWRYGAAVAGESGVADKRWLNVAVPKELRQFVKFRMAVKKGGEYYAVPGFTSICSVLGFGNTIQEALGQLKDRVKEVKASGLEFDVDGLDHLMDDINEGKRRGVNF